MRGKAFQINHNVRIHIAENVMMLIDWRFPRHSPDGATDQSLVYFQTLKDLFGFLFLFKALDG